MKPVVNGKASLCQWELTFSFLDKLQVNKFIELLLEDEIDFDFQYDHEFCDNVHTHTVTVTGSWANNLTRISKMLEKVDYDIGK